MKGTKLLQFTTLILLLALICSCLIGCGSSEAEENSEDLIKTLKYETLKYDDVMAIAAENHEPLTVPNDLYATDMSQYYHADSGLLTQEEIDALRTEKTKVEKLTKEQAIEDADLFFRTWKYAYAAYYFMGEELFLEAREEVMGKLSGGEGSISGQKFADILYDSMNFLQDAHSSIDGKVPASEEDSLRYEYYFNRNIIFSKDSKGFYINFDDGKWYYSKASNEGMNIEPSVLENGEVVYSPVLMIAKADAPESSTITLKKDSETKEIKIKWTMATDVQYTGKISQQCKTYSQDGIYYIKYLDMDSSNGDVNDFINTAYEAKTHKVVIFDLRYTSAWQHWQLEKWIEAFTGQKASRNAIEFVRNNALRTKENFSGMKAVSIGNEEMYVDSSQGKLTPNAIPLIILTDKSVLSSIEQALIYLETLENSVVIGGNTLGCQLGGSVQTYYLPNSGVEFAINGFMRFDGTAEIIDGIGYEPDLWCDPKIALSATVDLLKRYDFIDTESVDTLKGKIDPTPVNLQILFGSDKINPSVCFGDITSENTYVSVLVNGEEIKDFTVKSTAEEYLSVEKLDDGRISLKTLKSYEGKVYTFTVTYKGVDYTFGTNDPSMTA